MDPVSEAMVDRLIGFDGQGHWLVSLHIPVPADRNPIGLHNAFRGLAKGLEGRLGDAAEEAVDAVADRVAQIRSVEGRGLALFACPGLGWSAACGLPEDVPARLAVDRRLFFVAPLIRLLDRRSPGVAVLVGRRLARFFQAGAGRMEEVAAVENDVPRDVKEGGWRMYEEKRIDHHILEHLHGHLKSVAARLDALVREKPGGWVVIGGADEPRALIDRWLTPVVRDRLIGYVDVPAEAPAQVFKERCHALEDVRNLDAEARLVARVLADAHKGRAALGMVDVAAAAARGGVGNLLIDEAFSPAGVVCRGCGMARTEAVHRQSGCCPNCRGEAFDPCQDVGEWIIHQTAVHKGDVTFIREHGRFRDEAGGIAALLRY